MTILSPARYFWPNACIVVLQLTFLLSYNRMLEPLIRVIIQQQSLPTSLLTSSEPMVCESLSTDTNPCTSLLHLN